MSIDTTYSGDGTGGDLSGPRIRLNLAQLDLVTDAARLVAFGMRPRLKTSQDTTYRELVQRAENDPDFYQVLRVITNGEGLIIVECNQRVGLQLAGEDDSPFRLSLSDYASRTASVGKSHERVLHGLAWLATATMAFPRPADLADDGYVGRVTVEGVDAFVREACRQLDERALADEDDLDVPTADPGLERAWRAYQRRHANGKTGDTRRLSSSTTGIISKAMNEMVAQGFLNTTSDERKGAFSTTPRFQVHVRELAASRAFHELNEMGIVVVAGADGTLAAASSLADADVLPLPR